LRDARRPERKLPIAFARRGPVKESGIADAHDQGKRSARPTDYINWRRAAR
jgi:hypothetical protein